MLPEEVAVAVVRHFQGLEAVEWHVDRPRNALPQPLQERWPVQSTRAIYRR